MQRATTVDELALVIESLAAAAVEPLVDALVDVAARDPSSYEFLDALLVILVDGCADETVIRDLVDLAEALELA